MFFLYIIQSGRTKRFYIGVTTNLANRIKQHNNGHTKSTRAYRPWILIYTETFLDKGSAYKREYYLKHPKGYLEKKDIVQKYQHGGIA